MAKDAPLTVIVQTRLTERDGELIEQARWRPDAWRHLTGYTHRDDPREHINPVRVTHEVGDNYWVTESEPPNLPTRADVMRAALRLFNAIVRPVRVPPEEYVHPDPEWKPSTAELIDLAQRSEIWDEVRHHVIGDGNRLIEVPEGMHPGQAEHLLHEIAKVSRSQAFVMARNAVAKVKQTEPPGGRR